ncbi:MULTISPECIES: ImmA/IrrE family metallo-endopeptidase [Clostridium]|uniref:ImmA/IrrE family metallo-endopeptidase n=1 Tax=Clostridium TaxID=1485 RepID=UPI000D715A69|nr:MULTISPECIES: ImmA/IrrE family metallo-endopeptidase [Clostridium]EGT3619363.1 ImmA/IrrE family metallo-endopeptidase [Clostridium perfringens]ELC8453209.1 ImmA/IrrE family metallo-endopeptidase [Clostridium perfringens]PWX32724.1 ImmA/IrrE family metallo-endopeptidase [Clostridium perfringens]USQ64451.1 ImmA/IrrE family metallo-endopeptidase [Clostridium sp. 16K-1-R1]HAT4311523.1 ImmA/IrrE family metallo-endopeptidase [Clostridium perfringens]
MNIKNLAKQLIKKYGLNDPLEIALAKGIILLEEDLGEVYGYSHTYKRQRFIHLNKNCLLKTKRLVCAHELGYLLIHPKEEIHVITYSSLEPKDDFERYDKIFAAHLLILDEMAKKFEGKSAEDMAKSLNLPLDLVLIKLNS